MLYCRDLESPESYIRWSYYSMIASALARRVWYRSNPITKQPDHNSLFCNLFILLCGPPATGKGRAMRQMKAVLKDPRMIQFVKDPTNGTMLEVPCVSIGADATTLESIYQEMSSSTRSFTHKADLGEGKRDIVLNCAHTSCSFLIEELGVLLTKESDKTVHFLNDGFDCGDVNYKTKHQGKFRLHNCCINIAAGCYPEFIRDNPHIIVQGFSSRLIVVYESEKRFHKFYEGVDTSQQHHYDAIVEHVKVLATKVVGEITLSADALACLKHIYPSFDDRQTRINKDPRLDNYYARKNIHMQKLAAIHHFSERLDSMVVEQPSVEYAFNELNRVEVRMSDAWKASGRNAGYEVGLQIVRYLEGVGDNGATYKRLLLDFTRDIKRSDFDEVLQVLVATGQVNNGGQKYTIAKRV